MNAVNIELCSTWQPKNGGHIYKVVCIANNTDNHEQMVVYEVMAPAIEQYPYARPLASFLKNFNRIEVLVQPHSAPVSPVNIEQAIARMNRPHISISQHAMVIARMSNVKHGGNRKQQSPDTDAFSSEKLANMFKVSKRSIAYAKAVLKNCPPEIIKMVDDGKISVENASSLIKSEAGKKWTIAKDKSQLMHIAQDIIDGKYKGIKRV